MPSHGKAAALVVFLGIVCALSASAQPVPGTPRGVLTTNAGFTPAHVAAIERGEVVVRALPSDDVRDVVVLGAVRVDRPRNALVAELRVSGPATRGSTRPNIHIFGTPARLADVSGLELTKDDLEELQRCQANACNFKLPVMEMTALRAAPGSTGADRAEQVTSYVRRRMVEYVTAYRERGNAAMLTYDDLGSVQASEAFEAMLRGSSSMFAAAQPLQRFLLGYPKDSLPGAENAFYWSVDVMPRVRPTMRIMHEVVYAPSEAPGTTVIAAKQLYANHYFEAGLEVIVVVDDSIASPRGSGRGAVVASMRRYRFDRLPGGPLDIRGRVLDGLREAVARDLRLLASTGKP